MRRDPAGDELERYYGFEMAVDPITEILGVEVTDLPIPDEAADMEL